MIYKCFFSNTYYIKPNIGKGIFKAYTILAHGSYAKFEGFFITLLGSSTEGCKVRLTCKGLGKPSPFSFSYINNVASA